MKKQFVSIALCACLVLATLLGGFGAKNSVDYQPKCDGPYGVVLQ